MGDEEVADLVGEVAMEEIVATEEIVAGMEEVAMEEIVVDMVEAEKRGVHLAEQVEVHLEEETLAEEGTREEIALAEEMADMEVDDRTEEDTAREEEARGLTVEAWMADEIVINSFSGTLYY
jgi:hypothetical protein